ELRGPVFTDARHGTGRSPNGPVPDPGLPGRVPVRAGLDVPRRQPGPDLPGLLTAITGSAEGRCQVRPTADVGHPPRLASWPPSGWRDTTHPSRVSNAASEDLAEKGEACVSFDHRWSSAPSRGCWRSRPPLPGPPQPT